jgi:hypothetical protein
VTDQEFNDIKSNLSCVKEYPDPTHWLVEAYSDDVPKLIAEVEKLRSRLEIVGPLLKEAEQEVERLRGDVFVGKLKGDILHSTLERVHIKLPGIGS